MSSNNTANSIFLNSNIFLKRFTTFGLSIIAWFFLFGCNENTSNANKEVINTVNKLCQFEKDGDFEKVYDGFTKNINKNNRKAEYVMENKIMYRDALQRIKTFKARLMKKFGPGVIVIVEKEYNNNTGSKLYEVLTIENNEWKVAGVGLDEKMAKDSYTKVASGEITFSDEEIVKANSFLLWEKFTAGKHSEVISFFTEVLGNQLCNAKCLCDLEKAYKKSKNIIMYYDARVIQIDKKIAMTKVMIEDSAGNTQNFYEAWINTKHGWKYNGCWNAKKVDLVN